MRTEVLAIDPAEPDPAVLEHAAGIIRAGGLVAFPTETVYGLGANALDPVAVERIFVAKERARDDPLIVHIATREQLDSVAEAPPAVAMALANAFWPGPLTLVLDRRPAIPLMVTAGLGRVAVRVPSHPVAHGLLVASGVPIAAPSANRFMRASGTTAAHVLEDLDGRIDLVLDGGPAIAGVESTVVWCEGARVRILRPGAISREAITAVLARSPLPVTLDHEAGPGPAASPGMMAKHYAPAARVRLFESDDPRSLIVEEVVDALDAGHVVGLALASDAAEVVAEQVQLAGAERARRLAVEALGSDAETVAARLFAALRALDAAGAEVIFVQEIADEGLGWAVNDRLRRASS